MSLVSPAFTYYKERNQVNIHPFGPVLWNFGELVDPKTYSLPITDMMTRDNRWPHTFGSPQKTNIATISSSTHNGSLHNFTNNIAPMPTQNPWAWAPNVGLY